MTKPMYGIAQPALPLKGTQRIFLSFHNVFRISRTATGHDSRGSPGARLCLYLSTHSRAGFERGSFERSSTRMGLFRVYRKNLSVWRVRTRRQHGRIAQAGRPHQATTQAVSHPGRPAGATRRADLAGSAAIHAVAGGHLCGFRSGPQHGNPKTAPGVERYSGCTAVY